jgi:hypothetical protein
MIYLDNYQHVWDNLYSFYTKYSAQWITAATNVQALSSKFSSFITTVKTLSSNWNKEFTVVYPQMIDIDFWYSQTVTYKNTFFINWLNNMFPSKNYAENQVINIVLYLKQNKPFSYAVYSLLYDEPCTPNSKDAGVTVECTACQIRYVGCNHHGGLAGYKGCDNANGYCTVNVEAIAPVNVSCNSTGGRQLRIDNTQTYYEKSTARVLNFKFKVVNRTWIVP